MKKLLFALELLLYFATASLVILAVWFPEHWNWLKFVLSACVTLFVAAFLSSQRDAKAPQSDQHIVRRIDAHDDDSRR